MTVQYTDTAHAEAEELFSYIANENPAAATAVIAAIEAAVARIRSFPRAGVATERSGISAMLAWPYRYLIFYEIAGDTIISRNVRHPARRRPS
jgi:toxin ParE1/3/4